MILKLQKNSTEEQLDIIKSKLEEERVEHYIVNWHDQKIIICKKEVSDLPEYVEKQFITAPYKLASREFKEEKTIVDVAGVKFGGEKIVVIAGPCAVENRDYLLDTARAIKNSGASFLRGGAFKPRTSPYSFRGLGEEGLKLLAEARDETDLKIVTEVMTPADVGLVSHYADILQVGARNMQNFQLLDAVGKDDKPVLLKRGIAATVEEWLLSAEYILSHGNPNVIFCERGIRTYETTLRNTLDLSVIPLLNELTHLPVVVDPSHATGKRSLVNPMSKAAIVAGADGLMVEVHSNPEKALSDGPQSLTLALFDTLMKELKVFAKAVGREI